MSTIHLVSPKSFEAWDWRSCDTTGIGGSETMHCEIAWRLAARGHTVVSYAPVPQRSRESWHRHVLWRHLDDMASHVHDPGLWVFIRGIDLLEDFTPTPAQRVWCVFQDTDILAPWDEAWQSKITRILGLCAEHCTMLANRHPSFASKIVQSRNGIREELVDDVLGDPFVPPRRPYRLTFASSPDRGLLGLLEAFKLLKFLVPEAELHICYGFDNMQKINAASVTHRIAQIQQAAQQPGVVLRGRMAQPDLYREWAQTAVMCAPTNFLETGYITLMEAQALGAIPIVNPIWAAKEYQLAGIGIPGDAERDQLVLRRYALAAAHLLRHPEGQEEIRGPMMEAAQKAFGWEPIIDQYEQWIQEDGLC